MFWDGVFWDGMFWEGIRACQPQEVCLDLFGFPSTFIMRVYLFLTFFFNFTVPGKKLTIYLLLIFCSI